MSKTSNLCENPWKKGKKILKNVKNPPKFIKNPSKFLNILKIMQNVWTIQKKWKYALKCQNQTINVPKPLKFLDSWPFLIPSPDIQKTKFFQFLLLASSLAQKLKKFCFLDVWVGIHLVVLGYKVVMICILTKNRPKPPKFAHLWRVNHLA